jgi:hypothetical protein
MIMDAVRSKQKWQDDFTALASAAPAGADDLAK